ncbi:MAG: DUF2780 domain-containing protein [Gammaproteobacteria bacterium]|nr:DUF2780 domain-containing protein [Gammaproteobacteria bacterium]
MRTLAVTVLALTLSTAVHATDANSLLKAGSALLAPQQASTTTTSDAVQGSLVDALTSKLGITPAQASGGAGALLGLAQGKLSADDSSALATAIPGLDQIIGSAPKIDAAATQSNDLLGQANSLLGGSNKLLGDNSSLQTLATLAPAFEALGLDASMVQQFLPVILDYVNQNGNDALMGALQQALLGG